jgi:hypothetical protein
MDPRWDAFAAQCRQEFGRCGFQAELIGACRLNDDIAWAAYFHLRDDAISWLHRSVPVLSDRTPISLIDSGKADEVRDCLWAFPC